MHFPKSADITVAVDHVTALEEPFVGLRVVEAAHEGPDGRHGGEDSLDHGGAALVRAKRVGVVVLDIFGYRYGWRNDGPCGEGLFGVVKICGGVVDSLELKR